MVFPQRLIRCASSPAPPLIDPFFLTMRTLNPPIFSCWAPSKSWAFSKSSKWTFNHVPYICHGMVLVCGSWSFVWFFSSMRFQQWFFPLIFFYSVSHHTRVYLWLHHFWSGSSLGMSQSFDGVHPIIEWELAIYHLINCINSIQRVSSEPLVTLSHPKLPPTIQKGIWNCYQNKMWIIVLWHSMDY